MASSSKTVRKARIKAADVLQRVLESSSESFSESSEDSLSDSDVASRARREKRVEPCCSTSLTQPKCMGSTRRTCRVVSRSDEPSGMWAYSRHYSRSIVGARRDKSCLVRGQHEYNAPI